MTNDIHTKLMKPFQTNDVQWRIGQQGKKSNGQPWAKCLAYIEGRAVMNRLDEVFGPGGWKVEYSPLSFNHESQHSEGKHVSGFMCGISAFIDGQWVTKWDGADSTDTEPLKGGLSSALKRAAVAWGIGRYLYNLGDGWADFKEDGVYSTKVDGAWYKWNPPILPTWALPASLGVEECHSVVPDPVIVTVPKVDIAHTESQANRILLAEKLESNGIPENFLIEKCNKSGFTNGITSINGFTEKQADSLIFGFDRIASSYKAKNDPKVVPMDESGNEIVFREVILGNSYTPDDVDWKKTVIGFGKNKGKKLSDVAESDLLFLYRRWHATGHPKTGVISPDDYMLDAAIVAWGISKKVHYSN